MKAGDIKKFAEQAIFSERKESLNPQDFNINDNYLLNLIGAYKKNEPPEYLLALVEGLITTEELTVQRRVAVLKMLRDVFVGLSKPNLKLEDKQRLKALLTAYFV